MRVSLLSAVLFAGCMAVQAQDSTYAKPVPPAGHAEAVRLWPGRAPLATGETEGDIPQLYTYPAKGAGVHPAVIVLPGGGYTKLVMGKEGEAIARWLNQRGVSAYVLAYRLSPGYKFPAPMLDGARAVRYVRANAAKLEVDPKKIGVWGFSAGGHLAGYLATIHDAGQGSDPVESVSDRPDFAILSYARLSMDSAIPRNGNMEPLLGEHPTQAAMDAVDAVKHVSADTSPSFIYSTGGDKSVDPLNASSYYEALKRAGVPVELHIFERGPHGTGLAGSLAPEFQELSVWPQLLAAWMRQNGWMKPAAGPVDFP